MLRWLRWLAKLADVSPPARVHFDDVEVRCERSDGTIEQVRWDEIRSIDILTTDAGPRRCDVFVVLHGRDRGCVVPQEAAGFHEFFRRLQALPGFDNRAVIDAMASTSVKSFAVLHRAGD